jgi:hypothetical protein
MSTEPFRQRVNFDVNFDVSFDVKTGVNFVSISCQFRVNFVSRHP